MVEVENYFMGRLLQYAFCTICVWQRLNYLHKIEYYNKMVVQSKLYPICFINCPNIDKTLLVIKTCISNFVRTTRFWNNLHQERSSSKHWKDKQDWKAK